MDREANTLRAQCLAKHLWEFGEGTKRKTGAPTPCGESTSFSPCLPGDGRLEACDPIKGGRESDRSQDLSKICLIRRPYLSLRCLHFVKSPLNSRRPSMPLVI